MEISILKDKLNNLTSNLIKIKDTADSKIDDLNKNLKNIQSFIAEIENEINESKQTRKQLEHKEKELKILLDDVHKKSTSFEENIKTIDESLNNVRTSISEDKTKIKIIEKNLEQLKVNETRLLEESENLMKNIQEIISEINNVKKEREDERKNITQNLENIEKQINDLKRREAVIDYLAFEASATPIEAFILAALILNGEAQIKEIQDNIPQPPSIVTRGLRSLEEKQIITILDDKVKLNLKI